MDSFELNKLIGAALGTVFVVFSVSLIGDALFHSEAPEQPGYAIAAIEPEGGGDGGAEEADITQDVFPLLADADPSAGEGLFRRCAACHTVEEGGANKIGPNLYGVIDRPVASHEGFSYSGPMTEFSQGGSVHWDFDHLTHFLQSPKGLVPGTAMSFAGLKNPQDLADILAYLNTLSASPAPLPEAAPAEQGEEAAAGEEGDAAQGDEAAEEGSQADDGAAEQEGAAPPQAEDAPAPADAASPEGAPQEPGAEASPDGDLGETDGEAATPQDGEAGADQPGEADEGAEEEPRPADE
ncbi:MAG: cytochrome c family protein [Rhizobiaceae bacterium]|nr:cytochrome c family protein [Rhizobiaceae bacterium]MCV0405053.1 cytochrome c family protein [Rhizobiaceae bacterium]